MHKKMSKKYIINLIRKVIPDVIAIYLTGSRADKTHKPDSDWDIRVIIPKDKIEYKKYAWHNYQANIDCTVLHDFKVSELKAPKLDVFVCDYGPNEGPYKLIWTNKEYEHKRKHLDFLKVKYLQLTTQFVGKYQVDIKELREIFNEVSHTIIETKREMDQEDKEKNKGEDHEISQGTV